MKLVIILCVFIGHVYSAPSPCNNLCSPNDNVNIKTSELRHSRLTEPDDLRELQQSLINQLQKTHEVDLKSTRPGNWTEHNDYITDNGTGSIHEERGQLVNSASKVNYYKRNYASSYGTGLSDVSNTPTSTLLNDKLNTHSTIDRSNIQNYEQPNYYNEKNSHVINHSLGSSSIDNLARLENFNEQAETNIHENSDNHGVSNTGDNWTRHNTFVTDGGRGKVYEEEGQFRNGPAKVRYYKKNYTSSFSTNNGGVNVVPNIPIVTIPNIDAQIHEIQSQLQQVNSHINQQTHHLSTNINDLNLHGASDINKQYDHSTNRIITNQNIPSANRNVVIEGHHEKYLSSQNQHDINSHHNYGQVESLPIQNHYIAPITHVQSTNTHQVEKQIYIPNINSQINSYSNLQQQEQHHNGDTTIRIPIYRSNNGLHINDDSTINNLQLNTNRNHRENIYNQQFEPIAIRPNVERHVEQHWSTSEHRSHSSLPQQVIVGNQHEINNDRNLELLNQQHYGSLTRGGYDNINHGKSKNYISGSSSSYRRNYESGIHHDNVHSGNVEHRYHDGDCDDVTHVEYNPHGRIRYKRDIDLSQHNEDLTQQTEQAFGKLEFGQQNYESDNLQRTQRYHDSHQTDQHGEFGDITQQHTGNLELDQQQSTRGFEDFTQQHTGNLELDQQHHQHQNGQLEFGQQTENHDRYGQYRHHNSHGYVDQDSTQQSTHGFGDFTQQHTGNLELDQQHHQHQNGQLEFGQQTEYHDRYGQYRHHSSHGYADQDSTQQSTHGFEDFTQQHTGNLELDQQHHQYQNGQLEFGQATENHGHYSQFRDHYPQQQSGSLEFGQQHEQTQGNYYGSHIQKIGDLSQQSQYNQSLIEQSSRHNHFTQQQSDDLTQQTRNIGDLSQQTYGNLEYGRQTQNNVDLSHITSERNFGSAKPAPKPVSRSQRIGQHHRGDTEVEADPIPIGVKGGRRKVSGQYTELNSHNMQQNDHGSDGVLSLEQQIKKDESINVFQPRILEAYGGNGPYDINHHENIYSDVKLNPSATLAPIVDGKDPWDIRETSSQDLFGNTGEESIITETSVKLNQDNFATTTVAPGFWKKLGHKITSTYEKAKDKVSDVFG